MPKPVTRALARLRGALSTFLSEVASSRLLTALVVACFFAWLFVVGVLGAVKAQPAVSSSCIVQVEFAGTYAQYEAILRSASCGAGAAITEALWWDFSFILVYSIGLAIICWVGARAYATGAGRTAFILAGWGALAAGVFDVAENLLLLIGIESSAHPDWAFAAAKAMALDKFVSVIPAVVGGVLVLLTVLLRVITERKKQSGKVVHVEEGRAPASPASWGIEHAAWEQNYRLPEGHMPDSGGSGVGVCLSGGGIRSATFSLGAVQSLAAGGVLDHAQFMTTVSGGGYFGAAYQGLRYAALRPRPPAIRVAAGTRAEVAVSPGATTWLEEGAATDEFPKGTISTVVFPMSMVASVVLPEGIVAPRVLPKDTVATVVLQKDTVATVVLPKDTVATVVLPKDTVATVVLPKDTIVTAPGGLSVESAFAPGSPEEDFVRRHGKYIASGPVQWLVAVFVVLRNIVLSLGIVYAVLVISAWMAAVVYSTPPDLARQLFPARSGAWPSLGAWALIAVVTPLVVGLVIWILSGFLGVAKRQFFERTAGFLGGVGVAVAIVGIGIPYFTAWIVSITVPAGTAVSANSTTSGVRAATVAAVLATVTTVWNAVAKVRAQPGAGGDQTQSWTAKILAAAGFAIRFLLSLLVVVGVAALALVVFAVELHNAVRDRLVPQWSWVPAVAAVALVVVYCLFDQTRMSLHPFYKRRMASAFSVERHGAEAREMDYAILSTLSQYGVPLDRDGEPTRASSESASTPPRMRLIQCAAAHVSGSTLAPPGRRVVPFVFSSDFIGSPKLGYFPTAELETKTAKTAYASDITLLAASAISGAAFASAMGRMSGPFDLILALSNARLGAWLPNPRYHALRQSDPAQLPRQERTRRSLPKARRLGYFVREICGVYPTDDRFVYVTDGGHYENLALVELLRRRCTVIYCVDASGDASLASDLASAAALAYEELGVEIRIDGSELATLSAEEGTESNEQLKALHKRLTARSVVVGTFTYPALDGLPTGEGKLIVGKAKLGEDLAKPPSSTARVFPLKTYASATPDFPSDSTADQWFDVDQFQGYLVLGNLVGERMVSEATRLRGGADQR